MPPATSCFLPNMTEPNPHSAGGRSRLINGSKKRPLLCRPRVGVPGGPGQPRAGERCLPPSSGSCASTQQRGAKGKGQRGKANKEKKHKKRTCKADKRQLKGKQEDTISESAKNDVSNASLTRAAQTSSFHTHASDSTWSG